VIARPQLRHARAVSITVLGIMAAQSALGLAFPDLYRDVAWIRATWFGNDLVTLAIGVPIMGSALHLVRRGDSAVGCLLWFGMLGYGVYNYAFYMLGAELNAFFPLYVLAFVSSVLALILLLHGVSARALSARFRPRTPVRFIGGAFAFVATGLASVWIATWAAYIFAGKPTPVEPQAFRLVAALDLALMVPALGAGGILLWRRASWGFILAAIAGVQGSLYLLVLSLNSLVAIRRGLAASPGEVPIWGTLALFMIIVTCLFLASAQRTETETERDHPRVRA
jgi:hypothetical protein